MKNLIERYLEYISDRINNWDYTDIDAYCEDEELDDKEIGILLDISMKVVPQGEIERLEEEKDWQLNQIIKYKTELYFDCYGPGNEGRLNALQETEEEMQQTLKGQGETAGK